MMDHLNIYLGLEMTLPVMYRSHKPELTTTELVYAKNPSAQRYALGDCISYLRSY